MSCTGIEEEVAPGSLASLIRRRAMILSADPCARPRFELNEHHPGISLRAAGESDHVFQPPVGANDIDEARQLRLHRLKEMLWSAG